jgi:hypothetical protein
MASRNPDRRYCARNTFPNLPSPNFLWIIKPSLLNFLFGDFLGMEGLALVFRKAGI